MITSRTDGKSPVATPQHPELAKQLLKSAGQARKYGKELLTARFTLAEDGVRRTSLHADYAATALLRHTLGKHDWPCHHLVGEHAAHAALQIALRTHQHGLQRVFLQKLHEAVEIGRAPRSQWAYLLDRFLVNGHDHQLYGTQYQVTSTGPVLLSVSTPDTLDAHRAEVGLPPAAETLNAIRKRLQEKDDDMGAEVDAVLPTALAASSAA